MLDKKINLEEIIENELYNKHLFFNKTNPVQIKNICIEFGKQLLELAAENAEMILLVDEENDIIEEASINKQSILDTINQVE